jgi:hypothetical protein
MTTVPNAAFGRNQTGIQDSRFKIQETGIVSIWNLDRSYEVEVFGSSSFVALRYLDRVDNCDELAGTLPSYPSFQPDCWPEGQLRNSYWNLES